VIDSLRQHLSTLDAQHRADCHACDALRFLETAHTPWHIVFVDPPFGGDLALGCCRVLAQRKLVAPGGLVYVETGRDESLDGLPERWESHREKTAGGVAFRLFRVPAQPA
jgi:16S rRNA (guanine966-N2)-methyltransferase